MYNLIMVTYHRSNDTIKSIMSILQHTTLPFKLSIIDNSAGGLEVVFERFKQVKNITIYRNSSNFGKGRAFMTWFNTIIAEDNNEFFIAIDADIIVGEKWLELLIESRTKITDKFAMLAPIIMNNRSQTFEYQMQTKLIMHKQQTMQHYKDELYSNTAIGGPLLLIDKQFFISIGGYLSEFIYGGDDGYICNKAKQLGYFTGITTNVSVLHSKSDEDSGYQAWKREHLNKDIHHKGYWDQ